MKTLKDAKVGETVKATKLTGEGPVKRRIMDMGITKGVEIYVRKVAPHHVLPFRPEMPFHLKPPLLSQSLPLSFLRSPLQSHPDDTAF